MGKAYYKELSLYHIYDSELNCLQKLLVFLVEINENWTIHELSSMTKTHEEDVKRSLEAGCVHRDEIRGRADTRAVPN